MSTIKLLHHGEYVKPQYAPKPNQTESWAGQSTDKQRKGGAVSGIVKRYDKNIKTDTATTALGLIKSKAGNSIEYTGSPPGLRGLLILLGIAYATMMGFAGFWRLSYSFFDISDALIVGGAWTSAILFIFWPIRLELFGLEDEPIIFDRQHRKVYRIFRETSPGIKGLFKYWPMRAAEYNWDLIDVEHNARFVATGTTVTRYHSLIFIVKRSATDPTIIDSFNIGSSMILGEQTVPAVWEHIRRFMEENGPALPKDETLAPIMLPQTLWQSLCAVGPFGAKYFRWWKDELPFMLLIHVLFPFFLPFFLLWGFFNWLGNKTAIPIEWPQEVLNAINRCTK